MPLLFKPKPVSQLRKMWADKCDELQALKYHEQADALLYGVEAHYLTAVTCGSLARTPPRPYVSNYSSWTTLEAVWALGAAVLKEQGYLVSKAVAPGPSGVDNGGQITVTATFD